MISISKKNQYRYSITYNNTTFECLFFSSSYKKLVVSLCGGRDSCKYPRFLRWKYYYYLNANFLCIEDPMYKIFSNETHAFWYYGTSTEWYIEKMSHIIHKFVTLLDINIENVIFLGSSGGGTTAIHLANIFAGSCAVAMNPQYDISKWNIVINNLLKEKLNIDLNNDNDNYSRIKIKISQPKSRYFLIENLASKVDREQFIPFFIKNNIPIVYGISQHNNIVTWIHHTNGEKKHSSNPEYLWFLLLDFLNSELKNGNNINSLLNLSYIFNECLNNDYTNKRIISKLKKEINSLQSTCKNYIKLMYYRYKILSILTTGKKKEHYMQKSTKTKQILDDINGK